MKPQTLMLNGRKDDKEMRCSKLHATISEKACFDYRNLVLKTFVLTSLTRYQLKNYHPCIKCRVGQAISEGKPASPIVYREGRLSSFNQYKRKDEYAGILNF